MTIRLLVSAILELSAESLYSVSRAYSDKILVSIRHVSIVLAVVDSGNLRLSSPNPLLSE